MQAPFKDQEGDARLVSLKIKVKRNVCIKQQNQAWTQNTLTQFETRVEQQFCSIKRLKIPVNRYHYMCKPTEKTAIQNNMFFKCQQKTKHL